MAIVKYFHVHLACRLCVIMGRLAEFIYNITVKKNPLLWKKLPYKANHEIKPNNKTEGC